MVTRIAERLGHRKVFYGWVIVAVSMMAGFVSSAVWNPNVSVFVKPVSEELGWTRTVVSGAVTLGGISAGLLGAVLGPVIDKRGARLVLVSGAIVLGICLVGLSQARSIPHFYLCFGIARMVVAGAIALAVSVAISNWFVNRRGRAMAITLLGERSGSALLPLFSQHLVLTQGWRIGWLSLGILSWILAVAPCAVFMRRRPEDIGLRPDGQFRQPKAEPEESILEPTWTAKEAVKTRTFWLLVLASSQVFMIIGGVNLHQLPYMTDIGLSPSVAVGTISIASLVAGAATLLWGLLSEKFSAKYCLFFVFLIQAASLILLMAIKSVAMAYAYAVLWGLSLGGVFVLVQLVWPHYFGRFSLGAIRGLAWPIQMVANSVGPLLAGWVFDTTGSYRYAFELFTVASILAAVWMLFAKTPQHSTTFEGA